MKEIKGQVVLITGGASGIGYLLAQKFARDRAKVVIWDINQKKLDETVEEFVNDGYDVYGYVVDISKKKEIVKYAKEVKNDIGTVDVLVNNAGVVFDGDFHTMDDDQIQLTMDVNLMAPMWTTKQFLPDMIKKRAGHIVNIASASGLLGVPQMAAYSASKHALIGFTESVRLEVKKMEIPELNFTTVCPSFINTGMFEGVTPPALTPMLEPDEITNIIYRAYKNNESMVLEPFMTKLTPALKGLLPTPVFDFVSDLFGVTHGMDTFVGRRK